jgi:hypothetical protein
LAEHQFDWTFLSCRMAFIKTLHRLSLYRRAGAFALRTEALLWIAVELRNLAVLLPELDVVTIDELLSVLFRSLVVRACQLDCLNKSAITSNYVNPVPGHLRPFRTSTITPSQEWGNALFGSRLPVSRRRSISK